MRIVYMGTPDIAVPTLRYLAESKHQVVGVLTQPDRPKGRGHHTIPTAVKAAALEYDIPVYQPLSLRKGEDAAAALETLRQLNPDLIVVLAYGQILPKEVLELPKYGCINLHASLLPAYRGAAPIQWVILNGETKTGVTAQQMGEGLDTGDMLVKKETAIGPGRDRRRAVQPSVGTLRGNAGGDAGTAGGWHTPRHTPGRCTVLLCVTHHQGNVCAGLYPSGGRTA